MKYSAVALLSLGWATSLRRADGLAAVEAFVTPGVSGRSKSKIGVGSSSSVIVGSSKNGLPSFERENFETKPPMRRDGEIGRDERKQELKQCTKNGWKAFASGALSLAAAIFFGGDTSSSAITNPSDHSSISSTAILTSTATATEETVGGINAASDESLLGDLLKVIMDEDDDDINGSPKIAASIRIENEPLAPETTSLEEDAASEELRKAQEAVKAAQAKLDETKKESATRQSLEEYSKPEEIKAIAEEKTFEEVKSVVEKVATAAATKTPEDSSTKVEGIEKVLEPKRVEQPSFEGMKVEVIKPPSDANKAGAPITEDATTAKSFESPFSFVKKKETPEKKEPSTALVVESETDDQGVSIPKELIIGGGGAIAVATGVVAVSSGVLGGGGNIESVPKGQSGGGSTWKPPEDVPYGLRGKQSGVEIPKGFTAPISSTPKGAVTTPPKMGATKVKEGAKTVMPPLKGAIMKKVGDGPLPPGAKIVKKVAKLPGLEGMNGPPKVVGGMMKSPDMQAKSASSDKSGGLPNTTSPKGVSFPSKGAEGMTKTSALNQQPASANMTGGIAKVTAAQGTSGPPKEFGGMMKSPESVASFAPKNMSGGMPKFSNGVGGMMRSPGMKSMTESKSAFGPPTNVGGMMKSPEMKATPPSKNMGGGSSGIPVPKGSAPETGMGATVKSPKIQSQPSFGNLSGEVSKTQLQPSMEFQKASSSMSSGSMPQTPAFKSSPSQKGISGIPMKGAGPLTKAAPKWKTSPSQSSDALGVGQNRPPLNYSTTSTLKSPSLDAPGSSKSGMIGTQGMPGMLSKGSQSFTQDAPKLKSKDGTVPTLDGPGSASLGGLQTGIPSNVESKSPSIKSLGTPPKDASSGPGFVMGSSLKGAVAAPKGMEKGEVSGIPGMPTKGTGSMAKAPPKWKSSTSPSSTGSGLGSGVPGGFAAGLSSKKETIPPSSSSSSTPPFGSSPKGSSSSGPGFVMGSGLKGAVAAPKGMEKGEVSGIPGMPTKGTGSMAKAPPKWKSSTSPSSTGGGLGSGAPGGFVEGLSFQKEMSTSTSSPSFGSSPKGSSSTEGSLGIGSNVAAQEVTENGGQPVTPGMPVKGAGPIAKAAPKWKSSSSSTSPFPPSPKGASVEGGSFGISSSPKGGVAFAVPKGGDKGGLPVMPGMPTKGAGPVAKAPPKWKSSTSPTSSDGGLGSGIPGGFSVGLTPKKESSSKFASSFGSPSKGTSSSGGSFGIGSSIKSADASATQKGSDKVQISGIPGMPAKGTGPVAKAPPKWKSSTFGVPGGSTAGSSSQKETSTSSSTPTFGSSPKGSSSSEGISSFQSSLNAAAPSAVHKGTEKGRMPVMPGMPTKGAGPVARPSPKWKSSPVKGTPNDEGLGSGVPGVLSGGWPSTKETSFQSTPSFGSTQNAGGNFAMGSNSTGAAASSKGIPKGGMPVTPGMLTKAADLAAKASPKWKSSPSQGSSTVDGFNNKSPSSSFQSPRGMVPSNGVEKGNLPGFSVKGTGPVSPTSSPDGPSGFSFGQSMKQQTKGSLTSSPYIPSYVDVVMGGSIGSTEAIPNMVDEVLDNVETNGDQYYQQSESSVPLQSVPPTDIVESSDTYRTQIQSGNPSQRYASFGQSNQFGKDEAFFMQQTASPPAQAQYETGQTIGFGTTTSFSRKQAVTRNPPESRRVDNNQSILNRLKSMRAVDSPGIDSSVGPPQKELFSPPIPNHSFNQPDTKSARDAPANPNSFLGSLASRTQGGSQPRDISHFDKRSRLDRLSTGVNDPPDRRNRVSLNQPKPSIRGNRGSPPSYAGEPGGFGPDDNEPLTVTVTDPRTGEKRKISVSPRNTGNGTE